MTNAEINDLVSRETPTLDRFLDLVADMREAQRRYFKFKSRSDLLRSKTLEQQVDHAIAAHRKEG